MLHHFITVHEQTQTESAIFVSLMCFLLPEDLQSEVTLMSTSREVQVYKYFCCGSSLLHVMFVRIWSSAIWSIE